MDTANTNAKALALHAACVLEIVGCFVLAGTVLREQPLLGALVVGAGAWLWGKLGFKPAQAILERIVYRQLGVELDDVKRLVGESLRPPAVAAAAAAAEPPARPTGEA